MKKYNEWERATLPQPPGLKKKNKKGQTVAFTASPRLLDATYRCDDREGRDIYIESNVDFNMTAM